MGHSVGDAAARSVKKSEKQAEKANRTPEQRVGDIRKLAEAGLAVHTADVLFLLSEYDKGRVHAPEMRTPLPALETELQRLASEVPAEDWKKLDEPEPHIPETLQE